MKGPISLNIGKIFQKKCMMKIFLLETFVDRTESLKWLFELYISIRTDSNINYKRDTPI